MVELDYAIGTMKSDTAPIHLYIQRTTGAGNTYDSIEKDDGTDYNVPAGKTARVCLMIAKTSSPTNTTFGYSDAADLGTNYVEIVPVSYITTALLEYLVIYEIPAGKFPVIYTVGDYAISWTWWVFEE